MKKLLGGNNLLFVEKILERAKIKDRMKIADFGCGANGYFVFNPSAMVGNHGHVYAVDVLKPVLDELNKTIKQESYKNIKTIWSNLEKYKATKIDSMFLDLVFLVNILHQSQKKVDIIREAIRVLKKGAKLVIVDWDETFSPIGPHKENKVNKDNLIIALNKLGLVLEEEFVAGRYHFGLIYKKI